MFSISADVSELLHATVKLLADTLESERHPYAWVPQVVLADAGELPQGAPDRLAGLLERYVNLDEEFGA